MEQVKKVFYIILGTVITALAINIFFVPYNISSGGASGLGIILNYLFNFPVGTVVLLLNIPLFIIASIKLGVRFTFRAIIGTVLLSLFIDITGNISNVEVFNVGQDYILSSIFGGIMMGLGLSFVFKGNASTGGSELLAQIVYKYRPVVSTSQLMLIIDAAIVILSTFAFKSFSAGLYSIIAIFTSKKTIDIVFEGVNYTKIINIITKKPDVISERIMSEIERGITSIKCEGEYTKEDYVKLECVATITQIYKIKEIVKKEDSKAFMYIAPASEVLGYGFEK